MEAIGNGIATTDQARTVVEAVRRSLAELDGYSIAEMTEDVELAELVGRVKSLAGVLAAIVER